MTGNRTNVTIALTLAVVLATFGGHALASSQSEPVRVHPDAVGVNTDEKAQAYNQSGSVSGDITSPNMEVTVSDDREGVGLSWTANALKGSTRNNFIRVTHKEDMTRTVQIPISADYWSPYPYSPWESLDGEKEARMEPVTIDGEQYALITVEIEGEESAVFPLPADARATYRYGERVDQKANDTLGLELGLQGSPWDHIDPAVFTENQTSVRLEGQSDNMIVQYNAGTSENPDWRAVPTGQRGDHPYYIMEKDGVDNAVYLVSTSTETPRVRYKEEITAADTVDVYVTEAGNLIDNIMDGIDISLPFSASDPGVLA